MVEGKQALSCGFVTIGKNVDGEEGICLSNLIPSCDSCDGDIVVEMLDEYGITKEGEIYSYYIKSRGNADGWHNEDDDVIGDDVDDIEFPAGIALWVTGIEDTTFDVTSPIK